MIINVIKTDSSNLCKKDMWEYIEKNNIGMILCEEQNEKREETEEIKKWLNTEHGITVVNLNMANFILFCNLYSKHILTHDVTIANFDTVKDVLTKHNNALNYNTYKATGESIFDLKPRRKKNAVQGSSKITG